MKALLILPPFYSQYMVSPGGPQILSYLKSKNYDVKALDLNIKFFNYLYNEKVLNNLLLELYEIYKNKDKYNFFDAYYNSLDEFFNNKKLVYKVHNAIKNIDNIKQSLKSSKTFSNQHTQQFLFASVKDIQQLIDLIFRDIVPYDDRKYFINYSPISTYKNFLNLVIDDILKEKYEYIGFSVNSDSQFITSLITAKLLKEKGYKGKIGLGGTNVFKDLKVIKEDKSLFQKYVDIVLVGQGEYSHEEYFEFLNGKRELDDVCNIIYLDENENIVVNKEKYLSVKDYCIPCYDGYDFSEYMLPEPILPIRASYGCYWGKCTFCLTYYNNQNYLFIRKVDDLIEGIKFYIKTYNINTFYFLDSALPPEYLDEFATKIIKQKIKIYFLMQNRLEEAFDKTLLKKLYKAGLRLCLWGLESASPKILEKMNKGINVDTAQKIIRTAHSVGIANLVTWMYNFPEDTIEDFNLTYNFFKKNIKFIKIIAFCAFRLPTFSYMYSHPEEFGLDKELIKQAEIRLQYNDLIPGDMIGYKISSTQEEKIREIKKACYEYNEKQSGTVETLLLYYSKYNKNFLRNIHFMIQSICKK